MKLLKELLSSSHCSHEERGKTVLIHVGHDCLHCGTSACKERGPPWLAAERGIGVAFQNNMLLILYSCKADWADPSSPFPDSVITDLQLCGAKPKLAEVCGEQSMGHGELGGEDGQILATSTSVT